MSAWLAALFLAALLWALWSLLEDDGDDGPRAA